MFRAGRLPQLEQSRSPHATTDTDGHDDTFRPKALVGEQCVTYEALSAHSTRMADVEIGPRRGSVG